MDADTTREAPWLCIRCGYMMDAASVAARNSHKNSAPEEGDYSLCLNCAACYVRHGPRWQPITASELAAMHPENRKQIAIAQMAIIATFPDDLSKSDGRA